MGRIKTAVTKGVQKETTAVLLLLEPSLDDDEEQDVSSAANETVDAVSSSSSSSSSLLSQSFSSFSQRRILLCCSSDVRLVADFRGVAKSLTSADDPTPTAMIDDSCDSVGARPRGFAFMTASRAFSERHPKPSCLAISSIVMVDAAAKLRKARMGGTGCSCPSFSDRKVYIVCRGKSDENFRCPRCRVSLHWTCLSSGSSSTTGQDFVQRGSSLTNDVL